MKIKHFISAALALLLACSLPVTALAAEYDLAEGSVTVIATESGQTVTHGSNAAVPDDAPVIIQSDSETPTANTVTIKAEENAAANVTLDGVNIDTRGTLNAAVEIQGEGDVVIELDGSNTVQSGSSHAGVEKNTIAPTDTDPGSGNGNLTITDENETHGSLKATGGHGGSGIGGADYSGDSSNITISGSAEVTAQGGRMGAGIGGSWSGDGSNITITGNAKVTATGGDYAAGIGGGEDSDGSNITISGSAEVIATGGDFAAGIGGGAWLGDGSYITIEGNAKVTAKGGDYAAGIGGGENRDGSNITISGSAEVTATGGSMGAGIGGGACGSGSNITVSEDAQVKAQGGVETNNPATGAAIGDGAQYHSDIPGREETPNTDALNEGWIAAYAPGTENMDTAIPNNLTYKDASGTVKTANQNIAIEDAQSATCTQDGHKAGFSVDGGLVAVTIPATGHSFTTYTPDPDNLATCTTAGTKTATCENCTATSTVTDPAKGHSFTNYISNPDATYDHDGTKTATCDFCDATDTIPDPGSKLVRAAAPLYRVVDQDGKALACKAEQKDGVLTVTAEADFAALTGTLGGVRTLQARGVDTIVFVTNGAVSTFALSDLLAQDGDGYTLTHDGAAVTFTMTDGADVSKILQ